MKRVLWSVMVLRIHGLSASDTKSFTDVFMNVNEATRPHLYYVFRVTPINIVKSEGPRVINLVSSKPMSLNTTKTMLSQIIKKEIASLSSNLASITLRHIFKCKDRMCLYIHGRGKSGDTIHSFFNQGVA